MSATTNSLTLRAGKPNSLGIPVKLNRTTEFATSRGPFTGDVIGFRPHHRDRSTGKVHRRRRRQFGDKSRGSIRRARHTA